MVYTLNMFNTGQVTLPKVRRNKYRTKRFQAVEQDDALVITPIMPQDDGTTYYETENGGFGIYNEEGIDTDYLLQQLRKMHNE